MQVIFLSLFLLGLAVLLFYQQANAGLRFGPGAEGFASIGNPYNSPASRQSLFFRLGHQQLVTDILDQAL